MSYHFKLDVITETLNKVKDITKKIRTNVGKIRLDLIQSIKKGIKVAQRIQNNYDVITTNLTNMFENLKTAIVNTISYFLRPRDIVSYLCDEVFF